MVELNSVYMTNDSVNCNAIQLVLIAIPLRSQLTV